MFVNRVCSTGAPKEHFRVHLDANFSSRLAKTRWPELVRQVRGEKLRRWRDLCLYAGCVSSAAGQVAELSPVPDFAEVCRIAVLLGKALWDGGRGRVRVGRTWAFQFAYRPTP